MRFLKNNIFTIATLAFVLSMSLIGDASALGSSDVMSTAQTKVVNVFKAIKTIVFVIGGFGLIALAFSAIFGKVKWTWFAGLAFGLAVLAAAGAIVNYATGDGLDSNTSSTTANLSDSFNASN